MVGKEEESLPVTVSDMKQNIHILSYLSPDERKQTFICPSLPPSWLFVDDKGDEERDEGTKMRLDDFPLITPNSRESVVSPDKIKIFSSSLVSPGYALRLRFRFICAQL